MIRIVFSTSDKVFDHLIEFNISKIIVDETITDGYDRSIRNYNIVPNDQMGRKIDAITEGISVDYVYETPRKLEYVVMYDFKNKK